MTFLGIAGICKCYGAVSALADINLEIAAGSRTAIVGPSGSGKTTLLRIIAGFEKPDAGRITLDGKVLADGPSSVPAHRRSIGFVAQDGALFPHLTVADNIGFGLDRDQPHRTEHVLELMDTVELARTMRDRRPHELSGGQQQRVALARSLARRPNLMLLDEPFSALDTGLRDNMRKAVARILRAARMTTVLVTHDQTEALSFADQVAVLRDGRLAQAGAPQDLYFRPRDRGIAAFLGDAIVLTAELGDKWATCALGRIATDTAGGHGTAQILLRPEQVRLSPASADSPSDSSGAPARFGRITDIEFGGSVSTVAVSLEATAEGWHHAAVESAPLLVKCSSVDLPTIGVRVHITILGKAHVFDAEDQ